MPFIEDAVKHDKAVFVLVKTSNPSSGELQDKFIGGDIDVSGCGKPDGNGSILSSGKRLYVAVGELMESISGETTGKYGFTRVGAVVGATYPEEIEFLRARLKHTFFLIPGYGAQGGTAADVARAFDGNGRGAIVNSSRAIIAAWKKTGGNYAAAARSEALRMRDELVASGKWLVASG